MVSLFISVYRAKNMGGMVLLLLGHISRKTTGGCLLYLIQAQAKMAD